MPELLLDDVHGDPLLGQLSSVGVSKAVSMDSLVDAGLLGQPGEYRLPTRCEQIGRIKAPFSEIHGC